MEVCERRLVTYEEPHERADNIREYHSNIRNADNLLYALSKHRPICAGSYYHAKHVRKPAGVIHNHADTDNSCRSPIRYIRYCLQYGNPPEGRTV